MRIVICGAGQVGYGIAEKLASEKNDISVIDSSARLVNVVRDTLDVRGVVGHGSHPEVLAEAGADEADMLIAVTMSDEVNIVACQVAHSLFKVPTKIARIRAQSYLAPRWQSLFSREDVPIDVVISPEIEVGDAVLRRLALPGAVETMGFADDAIVLVGIACEDDCPIVDTPLKQLTELFPDLGAVVVGIVRGGRLFVPRSRDSVFAGDLAYVVARKDHVRRTLAIFGHEEQEAKQVVIVGGGNIGRYVARSLEAGRSRASITVIEQDRLRAVAIAEELHRTVILNGSALDREILHEADVQDADIIVTLTNADETNILSAVMARNLGCARNLALINNPNYSGLARALGIDAYVNPRVVTVSRILRHVRRGRIRGVQAVQDGQAEVIEAEALETSPLVGKPLREVRLPDGVRIGAIWRRGEVVMPSGDVRIMAHDRVVILALPERVRQVEQLFRVSLEFF